MVFMKTESVEKFNWAIEVVRYRSLEAIWG